MLSLALVFIWISLHLTILVGMSSVLNAYMCKPMGKKRSPSSSSTRGWSDWVYRTESFALPFPVVNKCVFSKPQLGKEAILGKEASIKSTCWKCLHSVPEKYTSILYTLQFAFFKMYKEPCQGTYVSCSGSCCEIKKSITAWATPKAKQTPRWSLNPRGSLFKRESH